MARPIPSLFSVPPPPLNRPFSLNDFPPISAQSSNTYMPDHNHQGPPPANQNGFGNQYSGATSDFRAYTGLSHPTIQGHGTLTWLSPRAGVITTADGKTISFQSKDFCDQAVNDLTHVLRVGFTLKYMAMSTSADSNQYTATHTAPLYGRDSENIFGNNQQDIELETGGNLIDKDGYSVVLEGSAYEALLGTFQRCGAARVQLSMLHNQMANYGDDQLYRYVGTSSMKRRHFVERRTHVFCLQSNDCITLQHPAVYQAVTLLSKHLLRRGGVVSMHDLYEYYLSDKIHTSIRDQVGYDHATFMRLITSQPFAFALFPGKVYVSARRNLPAFDYTAYVQQYFPSMLRPQQEFYGDYDPIGPVSRTPLIRNPLYQGPPENYGNNVEPWLAGIQNERATPLFGFREMAEQGGYMYRRTPTNFSTGTKTVRGPRSKEVSPVGSQDWMSEFNAEFRNVLELSPTDKKEPLLPIGMSNCTCKCDCGAVKKSNGAGTNRSSESGIEDKSQSSGSVELPMINPVANGLAPIGIRPSSMSTASSSSGRATYLESTYDLFGDGDLMVRGNVETLRYGKS